MTDERIWQLWREANNVHSVEVDMAFARLIEAAVREECAQICGERSRSILEVVPLLNEQFRGADSFVNGAWQEAENCAAAIRGRVADCEPKLRLMGSVKCALGTDGCAQVHQVAQGEAG